MWKLRNLFSLSNKIVCPSKTSGVFQVLPCINVMSSPVKAAVNGQSYRNTSFFNKLPADHLWKGVTSVSNAGKKRGRGKGVGKRTAKDLNRGQVIGIGKTNIVWPGLNAPILRGRELVQQQQLPEDTEREQKLIKIRDSMGTFRPLRLSPLERGWSGTKMPGRSIGPPDPIGEDTFEGFDSIVLEFKIVATMKGNLGRKRRVSSLVVTGNKKGLVGFALGKANDGQSSLRMAKNRAGQRLVYIEIYKNHTIFHNFFSQFGKTKIYASQKPEGYGLICHRAIKAICKIVGIKDLHAKIEGATNLNHIVKAFFLGLIQQRTHEQLAEEKRLNVVEMRKEAGYFPEVVATPAQCRKPEEVPTSEVLNYTQYVLGDRVILKKKKWPPFYANQPSYELYLRKQENIRNHDKVRLHMLAEYGEVRSFLTDKYPECRPARFKKPDPEEEQQNEAEAS